MEIKLVKNKLTEKKQTFKIKNKVLTLVGENGSGKSAILEEIFEKNIRTEKQRVICYSSGLNESFSTIFNNYINKTKKHYIKNAFNDDIESEMKSFYFNSDWVGLLVFFATSLYEKGFTRKFLVEKGYTKNGQLKRDLCTNIKFDFKVKSDYINEIENSLIREENEPYFISIRRTFLHSYLSQFIETTIEKLYEFHVPLRKKHLKIEAKDVINIFDTNVVNIFTFLSWATFKSRFIDINSVKVYFDKNIELNDLSSGLPHD